MKKAFILLHRWLGLALSLLFVVWFGSGMVMMFVDGMPSLTARPEFWLRKPLLDFGAARLGPAEAARGLHPKTVELGMLERRPVYRMSTKAAWVSVFADDGSQLAFVGPDQAQRIARDWTGAQYPLDAPEVLDDDQWTIGGPFKSFKPLYRIRVEDGAGTDVYVSSVTGEVVQSVNDWQRFWGYLGPVMHWLYFTPLRRQVGLWSEVVIGLSAAGSLLCLSGLIVGVWQFFWRRFRSPYVKFWLHWHHLLGLAFGVFAFTWVFSGMLSMDPFGSPGEGGGGRARSAGGRLDFQGFKVPPAAALKRLGKGFGAKKMRLIQVAGHPYYLAYADANHSRLVPAGEALAPVLAQLDEGTLLQDFKSTHPEARIFETQWLDQYDTYYYSKRQSRPLPVLKIVLRDREGTTYYVDPASGSTVLRLGSWGRANRWLYSALHRWDFPGLIGSLKTWYLVVLPFMLAGLALSLTGLVLSWKWLLGKIP